MASLVLALLCTAGALVSPLVHADEQTSSAADEGLLPIPNYSGDLVTRSYLSGDWQGLRQDWANRGITMEFDWYSAYQDIVDGGFGAML